MSKKWKSLIPLLCAQFFGLIGLGTSTFAWFISNIKITQISSSTSFSVKPSEFGFSITDGTQAWTSGGSITVTEGTDKKLAPAAHEDLSSSVHASNPGTWYYEYAESASSYEGQGDKTYLTSSDFGQYVYAQDFYFKASSTIAGIMVDSVTLPDSVENMGISVLFDGPQGHIEYNQTTPLGFAEHVNLVADVGPETLPEDELKSPYKVTAYIYIDGNNEYVKTANAQNIKGAISFGFSIYTPEQVIYFQSKKNTFGAPYNNEPIVPYIHAWYYVEDGEGHSTKYDNGEYPGQPMTEVPGRIDYYDTGCKENVTIWKKTFPIDAYTGFTITACDSDGDIVYVQDTEHSISYPRQTHDISWSAEYSGQMLAIENKPTQVETKPGEEVSYVTKYPKQGWVKFPEVLVNFYWQGHEDVTSSTIPVKTLNLIPDEIMDPTQIPTNTRRKYPFLHWYSGENKTQAFDLTQPISTSLLDSNNILNLYSCYGDQITEEPFDILLEAKSYWDDGAMNKPMLYMYDNFTGENSGYVDLGNSISVRDGKVYYRVTLSNFYDMYRFEKATSGGTIITDDGGKLKTEELHIIGEDPNIVYAKSKENECLWLQDNPVKNVALYGGWIENYKHNITFSVNGTLISSLQTTASHKSTLDKVPVTTGDEFKIFGKEFDYWSFNGVGGDRISNIETQTFTNDATIFANFKDLETQPVYFENDLNWQSLKAYVWDTNGKNNGWPGVDMDATTTPSGRQVYKIDIPSNANGVKFTSNDGNLKSVNIEETNLVRGGLYYLDGTMKDGEYNWKMIDYSSYVVKFQNYSGNVIKTIHKLSGSQITESDYSDLVPGDKPYYQFDGWGIDGTKATFPYTVTSDVTFTPCWTDEEIYLLNATSGDSKTRMTKINGNEYQISGVTLYKGNEIRIYSSKLYDITWKLDGFDGYSYKHSWSNSVETASYEDAKYFNYKVPMSSTNYTITYKPASKETYITADKNTLYFKPNSNWSEASATFFLYVWYSDGTNEWIKFNSDFESFYKAIIPSEKYSKISGYKYVRCSPGSSGSWNDKWNESGDMDLTNTDVNNAFALNSGKWSDWGSSDGSWSAR